MDKEIQWQKNVNEAKNLLKKKRHYQMEIAKLCLEVCEIKKGGTREEDLFTMKIFAEDIGCAYKTLCTWCDLYRRVFDKLDPHLKRASRFTTLQSVGKRVSKLASREKVNRLTKRYLEDDNMDEKILRYAERYRAIYYNFNECGAAQKCSEETLSEVLFVAQGICDIIKKERPEVKPIQNGRIFGTKNVGLSPGKHETEDGFLVRVFDKDIKVYNYMRSANKKEWFSPTEIGMKLGNHNKSSASAWSYRSLQKLMSLGYVERSDNGHYRVER